MQLTHLDDQNRPNAVAAMLRHLGAEDEKAVGLGFKKNLCPFGCDDEALDDNGYCDHLIGFTNDGKTYEPQFFDEHSGRRNVCVDKVLVNGRPTPELPPVPKGAVLIPITVSSRVYFDPTKAKKGKATDAND